jgi:hypothetical protein
VGGASEDLVSSESTATLISRRWRLSRRCGGGFGVFGVDSDFDVIAVLRVPIVDDLEGVAHVFDDGHVGNPLEGAEVGEAAWVWVLVGSEGTLTRAVQLQADDLGEGEEGWGVGDIGRGQTWRTFNGSRTLRRAGVALDEQQHHGAFGDPLLGDGGIFSRINAGEFGEEFAVGE